MKMVIMDRTKIENYNENQNCSYLDPHPLICSTLALALVLACPLSTRWLLSPSLLCLSCPPVPTLSSSSQPFT